MYRQYESPYALEDFIRDQEAICEARPDDPEEHAYLQELKERLNHAWEDMFEEDY